MSAVHQAPIASGEPPEAANYPIPAAAPAKPRGPSFAHRSFARFKADLFTGLLAAGIVILAFFLFLPLLDRAKVERREAKIRDGDLTLSRASDNLDLRDKLAVKNKGGAPTAEERRAFADDQERWKDEKKGLNHDLEEARLSEKLNTYWYTWGTFVGVILVTIASIGYAAAGQTTVRRVTGAVLICLLVITFLGVTLGKGPAITFHP